MPFFTDDSGHPRSVDVELGVRADGGIAITLAASKRKPRQPPTVSCSLNYSIGGGAVDPNRRRVVRGRPASRQHVAHHDLGTSVNRHGGSPVAELRPEGLGIDSHGNISDRRRVDRPAEPERARFLWLPCGASATGLRTPTTAAGGSASTAIFTSSKAFRWAGRSAACGSISRTARFRSTALASTSPCAGVLSIRGEIDHIHVDASSPDDLRQAGPAALHVRPDSERAGQPALPKKIDVFAGKVDVAVEILPGLEITGSSSSAISAGRRCSF